MPDKYKDNHNKHKYNFVEYTKMYFSQCQEDIFLNDTYFRNKRDGIYIELGALDGVLYSNTKFFQDQL